MKPDVNLIRNGSTEQVAKHLGELARKPGLSREEEKALEQALRERWAGMDEDQWKKEYRKFVGAIHPSLNKLNERKNEDVMKAVNMVKEEKKQ